MEKERGIHLMRIMDKFNLGDDWTIGETEALLKLIDLAVRHSGMNVAEAAVVLANKIKDAAKAAQATQQKGAE